MTIIQKMKAELLSARKTKNSSLVTLYSTLIGELEAIGKNNGNRETTDDEAVRHLKKWVSNIDSTISIRGGVATELLREKQVCMQYLPATMTTEQLTDAVKTAISEVGNKQGIVMKMLKDKYPNMYDGKEASAIFKELTQ